MKSIIIPCFILLGLVACSSNPEIPSSTNPNSAQENAKSADLSGKKSTSYPTGRMVATTGGIQKGLRHLEQDCQVYSQPNLYSQHLKTAQGGRDLWTEDTGSAWYKVYENNSFGYVSKICFK